MDEDGIQIPTQGYSGYNGYSRDLLMLENKQMKVNSGT